MNSKSDSLAREKPAQERQNVERRFRILAEQWKGKLRSYRTRPRRPCTLPIRGIIGLGEPALTLILHDLKQDPADWFWALAAITGENPVQESTAGKIEEMAEAWLRWGRERGWIN